MFDGVNLFSSSTHFAGPRTPWGGNNKDNKGRHAHAGGAARGRIRENTASRRAHSMDNRDYNGFYLTGGVVGGARILRTERMERLG